MGSWLLAHFLSPGSPALPLCDWLFLHLLSSAVAKDTWYPPISTRQPACSLSISTPEDWHWVSHAVAATFVPLRWPWAWEEILTLFSCVQASALCRSPGHQVGLVLSFCLNPCLAWFLLKGFPSLLWNEDPVLPLLCKLCLQGLQYSGNPSSSLSLLSCSVNVRLRLLVPPGRPWSGLCPFPSGHCALFPSVEILLPSVADPAQKPAISHLLGQLLWQTTPSVSCCRSVAKLCLTLCDLMDCSMTVSSVLYYLLEFAQIHVHRVGPAS